MTTTTRLLTALLITLLPCLSYGQQLAAFHDSRQRFIIFDGGQIIQADHLPVRSFQVGGSCVLYVDSRNSLKMYYNGRISTLEVNGVERYEALEYLSAYSYAGIIKIIEKGQVSTVSTHAVRYKAEDSLVTFYDSSRNILAVYYRGQVIMLEDGLASTPYEDFVCSDNLTAFISPISHGLTVFYRGQTATVDPYFSEGSMKAGRNVVAFVSHADQHFRVYYQGRILLLEDFPPRNYQPGRDIVAYTDNSGAFKIFHGGGTDIVSGFEPDFYQVTDGMVIFGEQGYFKVWSHGRVHTLENYVPGTWKAGWHTIVYRDSNRDLKVFDGSGPRVLTYDLVEDFDLYYDVIVVNKGMNNYSVYYKGREYKDF